MKPKKPRPLLAAGGKTTHASLDAAGRARLAWSQAALARMTGYQPSVSTVLRLGLALLADALSEDVLLYEAGTRKRAAEGWRASLAHAAREEPAPPREVPAHDAPRFPPFGDLWEPVPVDVQERLRKMAEAMDRPFKGEVR